MKGFLLFLVVVLLAYTYAAPQGPATNYGSVSAHSGSSASGVISGSTFGNDAFNAGAKRPCPLFQALFVGC
ncbi:hypothetical protein B5X24_HaOG209426 [Helicoverpa armigera]|uniref:Uncharacterized protein n=1 Tax=Helicoverpa armigera TaxID=29058 RepID=A0A2W1BFH5_HELAM|nr:hypothetical protein B5X24_HaOG209426 [Helicoverpa armigera]